MRHANVRDDNRGWPWPVLFGDDKLDANRVLLPMSYQLSVRGSAPVGVGLTGPVFDLSEGWSFRFFSCSPTVSVHVVVLAAVRAGLCICDGGTGPSRLQGTRGRPFILVGYGFDKTVSSAQRSPSSDSVHRLVQGVGGGDGILIHHPLPLLSRQTPPPPPPPSSSPVLPHYCERSLCPALITTFAQSHHLRGPPLLSLPLTSLAGGQGGVPLRSTA